MRKIAVFRVVCTIFILVLLLEGKWLIEKFKSDQSAKQAATKVNYLSNNLEAGAIPLPDNNTLLKNACKASFENKFEDNLKIILNYPLHPKTALTKLGIFDSGKNEYYHTLRSNLNFEEDSFQVIKGLHDPEFPVIVTAASSNHFRESQGLLKDIHEVLSRRFSNIKIIYYDLGLTKKQRQLLEKYCRCEVRTFDFGSYPSFFKTLHNYVWKPIIIQYVLQEYSFVMWNDASVRYTSADVREILASVNGYGIVLRYKGPAVLPSMAKSIAERTDVATFRFLGEEPCLYERFAETEAGVIIIARSHFTMRAVMAPWVLCALTYGCMVTDSSSALLKTCFNPGHFAGKCHRFEQSVLGIILLRLFHFIPEVIGVNVTGVIRIRRDAVTYFPGQK